MEMSLVVILLAVAFALAFLTESLVEYLLGTPMDKLPALQPYRWTLMYFAAAVGVALALYWGIDLISIAADFIALSLGLHGFTWAPSPPGMILTGLAIGRGSSFLHDFVGKVFKKPALSG